MRRVKSPFNMMNKKRQITRIEPTSAGDKPFIRILGRLLIALNDSVNLLLQ